MNVETFVRITGQKPSILENLPELDWGIFQKFLDKISPDPITQCWIWTAQQNKDGYGLFEVTISDGSKRRQWRAHRLAYELAIGPIPFGHHLHHKCKNRICCNPNHVESLIPKEHGEEEGRQRPLKTHCLRGHELFGDNIHISKRGKRQCKTCAEDRRRERYRQAFGESEPRSACEHGHEFTEANIFWYTSSTGYRSRGCRECRRKATREASLRAKQEFAGRRDTVVPSSPTCIHGHDYAVTGYSVSLVGQIRCSQCERDRANAKNAAIRAERGPKPPRTHCPHGHSLDGENGYHDPSGRIHCRSCHKERSLAYVHRLKEKHPPVQSSHDLEIAVVGTIPLPVQDLDLAANTIEATFVFPASADSEAEDDYSQIRNEIVASGFPMLGDDEVRSEIRERKAGRGSADL